MFGSNFDQNFGIPAFPLQGMDPQGGMLGANSPQSPVAGQSLAGSPQVGPAAASPLPASGGGMAQPSAPASLGAQSPLGAGALVPGAGGAMPPQTPETPSAPPAAGVGSPFGRPNG